jgi:hypothetical protein
MLASRVGHDNRRAVRPMTTRATIDVLSVNFVCARGWAL